MKWDTNVAGFWAEAAASGAISAALNFVHAAISSDSMQELCKSHRQEWCEALHEVIVQSGGEGQLKALAVLGQLCIAEWQAVPDHAVTSTYYCHKALQDKAFRRFVKAFHDAVQVIHLSRDVQTDSHSKVVPYRAIWLSSLTKKMLLPGSKYGMWLCDL